MIARISTRFDDLKIQRQMDVIETLDDQGVRKALTEMAGSMFLAMSLHILDGTPLPVNSREEREAEALERIPNLTESEALGVLVSLAGLTLTGSVLGRVAVV
jgi:hypothetical protein